MNRLFLYAAFAIALLSPKDQHHQQAVALVAKIKSEKTRLVTTQAVMIEVGNSLAKTKYRQSAINLIHAFKKDPKVEILPLSNQLYDRGFELYQNRADKDWGLTGCISFIVMQDEGITEALTTDEHFKQCIYKKSTFQKLNHPEHLT